jgi:hypothetical protein
MNSTMIAETITTQPTVARSWIAVGFALLAGAAIIDSSALTHAAPAQSAGTATTIVVPAQRAVSSDDVDWSRATTSTITPAETVGAYDR